jgi:hypothetical protein
MTRVPVRARRGNGARLRALATVLLCAAAACSGDDDGGGSAGSAPMVTPSLGEPCTNQCTSGLVCGFGGVFRGQCTAQCSGPASCMLLAPGKPTACVAECGLSCTGDGECPTGTICGPVSGQMVCIVPR